MKRRLFMLLFLFLLVSSFPYLGMVAVECSEVHDVAIIAFRVYPGQDEMIPPNIPINANVTVENQGTTPESFNVTLFFGNATIGTVNVTDLQAGSRTNVTFTWFTFPVRAFIFPSPWLDPLSLQHEIVTMKVEASVVPGEIDTADNFYVDGVIHAIWWVPDVDGNGRIEMRDIARIARAFGSHPGHPRWDPFVDFNSDEKIDMRDIGVSGRLFGVNYD